MKKVFITFSLLALTFLISGCGCSKKNLKTVTCNKNIKFDTHDYYVEYIISYNSDDKLIDYVRNEKFESDDEELLRSTLEYKNDIYSELNEIDGYTFDGNFENNVLTTKINIDFSNIDEEKLLEVAPTYQTYYNDEKKQFDINNTLNDLKTNNFECTE